MNKKVGISVLFCCLMGLLMVGTAAAAAPDACPTDNEWTGAVDSDWSNSSNWDCDAVPDESTNVVVPAGMPNMPAADQTVHVENLTVDAGATFHLDGQLLIVDSDLNNNGTLIDKKAISQDALPNGTCFFCTGNYAGLMLSRADSPSNPAAVQVEIKGNQGTCDNQNSTIGRCFDISPTQTSDVSIDAIFYFLPSELNSLTCSQLQMYHWDGSAWEAAGTHISNDCETTTDLEYNIRTDDITDFSPFAGSVGVPLSVSIVDIAGNSQLVPIMLIIGASILIFLTIGLAFSRRKEE